MVFMANSSSPTPRCCDGRELMASRQISERRHARHVEMTVRALTTIFDFTQDDAKRAVATLINDLPAQVRDRGSHEDPTSLAARLAGKPPSDLTQEPYIDRVRRYAAEVRPEFERAALRPPKRNRALSPTVG